MNPQVAMAVSQLSLQAFKLGLQAIVQMYESHEQEESRREWIRAHHETLREKFRLEQEALLRYYELKFAERKASLEELYVVLHEAVKTGNDFQLQGALFGILEIIKTDPLADYDQFALAFRDPDVTLEI